MAIPFKGDSLKVSIGRRSTVEIPARVHSGRLNGFLFESDKSFLLPSAMTCIRGLTDYYKDHPGAQVLIVGHADRQGDAAYNVDLSNERAPAIAAFLRDDVEVWLAWYGADKPASKRWGTREDQFMLTALPEGGTPFFAGPVLGAATPQSKEAVRKLQAFSNEHDGTSLAVDGVANKETRRALIKSYMALDGTTLPAGTVVQTHGCGEYHPIVPTPDGADEPRNRRVEIFFFDDTIAPAPLQRCPAPKGCPQYAEWRKAVTEDIDLCHVHHDEKHALELALRAGKVSAERVAALIVLDSDGHETSTFRAVDAGDDGDGVRRFHYDPEKLPNPATFVWRDELGDRRVAGPCDPVALRDALEKNDMDAVHALLKSGDEAPPADSPPAVAGADDADEGSLI